MKALHRAVRRPHDGIGEGESLSEGQFIEAASSHHRTV